MTVTITVELEADQAAALHRLCDKFSHCDAKTYLYPHLPRELRSEQASQMVTAADHVLRALREAGVNGFPWIDTGKAD